MLESKEPGIESRCAPLAGVCRWNALEAKTLARQESYMFHRPGVSGLLLLSVAAFLVGCSNPRGLDTISVSPTAQALAVGQTVQIAAVGTYGNASHPSTQNLSSGVSWTSSTPAVATVSSSGLVTAVGGGSTTITANADAFNGPVSASAIITVSGGVNGGGTNAGGNLLSLTLIPSAVTVGNLQDTGQFLAIGTFSTAPTVRDLTNSTMLTWISSAPSVFPISNNDPNNTGGNPGATAGVVTAYGSGNATIIAKATNSDGTIQTATATFNCPLVLPNPPQTPGSCYPGSQAPSLLATITVYNEGLNTTNWLVTAPSATGTPNVLHCGPGSVGANLGGSVCTATYPVGATVTLTAPNTGAKFGGWSYNCGNTGTITQAGPNTCTVTLTTNDTVGAIFN
ncbi:hypothetical protein GCM10011507_21590 [Edaphobacter acidisoli]|uniref:BIG2 domain-containing protein n=1 Tax=Edaphobacter acidisoli TaxID=2040573 RepID=A0A916RWK3_9BACT|nr:hypothetical protein GCM10011507_21590 [Edaphobacter acidisoli]